MTLVLVVREGAQILVALVTLVFYIVTVAWTDTNQSRQALKNQHKVETVQVIRSLVTFLNGNYTGLMSWTEMRTSKRYTTAPFILMNGSDVVDECNDPAKFYYNVYIAPGTCTGIESFIPEHVVLQDCHIP